MQRVPGLGGERVVSVLLDERHGEPGVVLDAVEDDEDDPDGAGDSGHEDEEGHEEEEGVDDEEAWRSFGRRHQTNHGHQ